MGVPPPPRDFCAIKRYITPRSEPKLAFPAGVFRRARISSLVGREEIRAPLKTPAEEAQPRLRHGDTVRRFSLPTKLNWITAKGRTVEIKITATAALLIGVKKRSTNM